MNRQEWPPSESAVLCGLALFEQDLFNAHRKGTEVRLDRYSSFTHYNVERQAVQVERQAVQIECKQGYVIANVPIAEHLVQFGVGCRIFACRRLDS